MAKLQQLILVCQLSALAGKHWTQSAYPTSWNSYTLLQGKDGQNAIKYSSCSIFSVKLWNENIFENVDLNSPGDITCRGKRKERKATTPFIHIHGAQHVQLWAVPKMLRAFVRILAAPNPEVVSSRKVNITLSLCLVKRHEKMNGGLCHSFMHI
jgi:hypothetical protein